MTSALSVRSAVDDRRAPCGFASREDAARRERALVEAARRGDAIAFRRIVEAHFPWMLKLAVRLVGDPFEAEDLVQESFVKAYTHLDRFDPRYRLSTWLQRIALNTCRDYLKSPRRRERADPVSEPADERMPIDDELALQRRAAHVRAAVARLRPKYREVLILKYFEDLTNTEIERRTGDALAAVKIRVLRARGKLRELLMEDAGELVVG